MDGDAGELPGEDALAEGFTLNEADGLKAAELMRCEGEAADPCEGVEEPEGHRACLAAATRYAQPGE